MLIRGFETTEGRVAAGPATATFELPATAGIRGRLVDAAGNAVADRVLQAIIGTDKPAPWQYESEPQSVLAAAGNALRVLLPEDKREQLLLSQLICPQVVTDSEGRFDLPLPAVAIPGLRLFNSRRGDQVISDSCEVAFVGEVIDDFIWKIGR